MHNVSSVPNLWGYRAAGAIAGAAASRGAMHVFKIVPSSGSGLLMRAGFAFAGGWIYSRIAQEMHSRAVSANELKKLSYLTALTATVAFTRLSYEAAPPGKGLPAAVAGLIFSLLGCAAFLPAQIRLESMRIEDRDRDKPLSEQLEELAQNFDRWKLQALIDRTSSGDEQQMLVVEKFPVADAHMDGWDWRLTYPTAADVPWDISSMEHILKSLPAEKVLPRLRILQQMKSPWLPEALNDVFLGKTQLRVSNDFVCEFIDTLFESDALFNHIPNSLKPIILHHTAHDHEKQKRLLQHCPLGESYIHRVEGSFQYPRLAEATIDYLMEQDNRSVWDIAFCAQQRVSARMALSSLRVDELLPLNILCRSYSLCCTDHSFCWESSLIKLAAEELSGDKAKALLQLLSTNDPVWFKFVLRHVLRDHPTQLSDDQLMAWANRDLEWEVAQVIVDARPHLYSSCHETVQSNFDLFMTPATYSAVIAAGFKPRHVDVKTVIDALSYVSNASVAKLEEAKIDREKTRFLLVQELKSFTENNYLPIYLYADATLIMYLTEHHGFDFSSFPKYRALYDLWHSTETHCLPLNFFFHEGNNYQHVLPWLANALTSTAAVEVTPTLQAEFIYNATSYARIARLWGFGQEGDGERLAKLIKTLQLGADTKRRFEIEAFESSLFYSYHDHWDPLWGKFRSEFPEAAIIHLASLFRSKGTFYNVLEVKGCIATFNNDSDETDRTTTFPMDVVQLICRSLSIQERLRFARTSKGMLRYICREEGEPIWRALGSLRAVRDMYRLYRLELNNGEAKILLKAILRNLPHLREMKHA